MKNLILFLLALAYVGILAVTVGAFINDASDVVWALVRMFVGLAVVVLLFKHAISWNPPKKN